MLSELELKAYSLEWGNPSFATLVCGVGMLYKRGGGGGGESAARSHFAMSHLLLSPTRFPTLQPLINTVRHSYIQPVMLTVTHATSTHHQSCRQ